MQITINKANSQTNFEGTIQVQSSRPVYNSDYNAPVLLVNDNDFDFSYAPGTCFNTARINSGTTSRASWPSTPT